MAKWILNRPGTWDYATLGFTATNGAILDAATAPDGFWALNGDQAAAETVTRYGLAQATPPFAGTADEAPLLWSTAQNRWVAAATSLDATVAAKVQDGPLTKAALGAAYARLPGPLGGWKAKLASDPANAKVVVLGDSTSDPATNAATLYRRLLSLHARQGEALHGLASADYFTDGVGNGTTTFTSATANFTAADVGRLVHGRGFPNATKITAVTNSTTVTISGTIPTGTGLPFWVGRRVIGGGNNGKPLIDWMNSPSDGASPYNRDKLVADAPDLTVASWLINDVRQGALGLTEAAIFTAGRARLQSFIDWHRTALPNTDLLLRMPNALLSANVGGSNYVTDGTNVNPTGLAQTYSTALRRIYLSFVGQYPNVDVLDTQAEVFGTRSLASSPLMTDQLHPSAGVSGDAWFLTPVGGGYVAIADAIARRIGFDRNAYPATVAQRIRNEYIVYDAPAAGQVRLISRDYNHPASQGALSRSDSLYVAGIDSPIALTSATFDRLTNVNWLVITGLGSTDFAPAIGQPAAITGSHGPSFGESTVVNFDLPSIAAGGTYIQSITITGVAGGNLGHRAGIVAIPPNGFASSGLIWSAAPSGTDAVAIVFYNPTGAAIDRGSENWTIQITR